MGMKYSWLIEGRVVLIKLDQTMTEEMLVQENTVMADYFSKAKVTPVHVIADFSQMTEAPSINIFKAATWTQDSRLGWFLFCEIHPRALQFALLIGSHVLGFKNRRFDTLQEALDFLRSEDKTLAS